MAKQAQALKAAADFFLGFKGCPKRATGQFRGPIETACRAYGGTIAKQAPALESCCGRALGF